MDSKGLYTYPNILSQVPPGAMTIAMNGIVDRPGVFETRRGFEFFGDSLPSYALKGFAYSNRLLWYCSGGQLVYDSNGSGAWTTYSGTYSPPTSNFVNSTQASGNFYFTTNNGVYVIDSLTGTPRQSGVPEALDITLSVNGTGTAIPTNAQVSYTVLWGYLDANNNLILGAPSQWATYTNTSGSTNNIDVAVTIPSGITTSHFVQVYRTAATSSSAIVPGNTFQLTTQKTPTSGEITAKTMTITDTVPDTLLGAYLYTADGQPDAYPNNQPPLCNDIATFNSMTFYMNFETLQQATITLDAVGATSGIQNGDTLTITDQGSSTSFTYTGAAANNFATHAFKVDTSSTLAANIDNTAKNLCACINQDTTNGYFYAYYQTGTNVLPGAIILKARTLQQGAFFVNTSRTTCWTPVIPISGQTYISSNTSSPESFMVSKVSQPESVPLVFSIPVQSGNTSVIIYRGLALQDALYLLTNAGIFRVTGTDPTSLQVILFDSSAVVIGLQTPQILNNSIYYYSSQGICSASSGGNQIVSQNIERDVIQLSTLSNFSSLVFGCVYESDRKYMLYAPSSGSDTIPTQTYVYNWLTKSFTTWNRFTSAAIVNPNDNMLYVTDGSGNVFQERKSFSNTDYSDQSYTITISSIDTVNNTFTLSSSTNVEIGDIIQQTVSGTQYSTQVTSNSTLSGIVGVDDVSGFTAGSAADYRSISTTAQYCPLTAGFPNNLKKFTNWKFVFSNANFDDLTVTFTSDFYATPETATISPVLLGGWGVDPWGTKPWGVDQLPQQAIPCNPSLNTSYAKWINVKLSLTQAFTSFSLDGITASFDVVSNRGR